MTLRRSLALALGFAAAVAALAAPAGAATVAGVTLPDSTRLDDAPLVLNGAALRSKLFFKVYVGGLYLPERRTDAAQVLAADETRRMELHFLRNVSTTQLCDSWKEGLVANSPAAGAELKAKFDRLCAVMENVHEGSVLALTYRPATGTEIAFDGKSSGSILGKDFADALLGCWIGPDPGPGADFKKAVLGG